ncbi:post-GPI attachment to proteins factor 6-like isoform X3 [Amblyomma americanum]
MAIIIRMAPASWSLQNVILIIAFVPWQSASGDLDTAAMSQSLEPRLVYPYRRYGDVTLLPFVVPQGTLTATWMFKANISSHCRPDTVHLYLQFAGLPVLSPLNATFPDHFVTKRQRMRSLIFSTDSQQHIINVTSPDPGQWFAAAFTLDPHQRILQKDLFSPCEVYLSSSLTPYLLDGVVDILPGQPTAHSIDKPTYFRFATSREMWSLDFGLSECKVQGNSTAGSCPLIVYATAEVPPSSEVDGIDVEVSRRSTLVNCTEVEPCSGTMIPAVDAWNYILVLPTLGDRVEFKILLKPHDCRSTMLSPAAKSRKKDNLDMLEKMFSANATMLRTVIQEYLQVPNFSDACWPSHELAHINMPGTFEYGYRLDTGPDESNFTSGFNLSLHEPTLVTFRVFPVLDSGGTLSINLHLLSPDKEDHHHLLTNVTLRAVLAYGSRPPLKEDQRSWEWGSEFQVNTSASHYTRAELHVPYPEFGLWFLGLLPLCYFDESANSSEPRWTPCEMESVQVELSINSTACLNNKCGLFGRCFQYISGGMIFSSCYCTSGYRGWGCTDKREAFNYYHMLTELLLLTLSNLFLLPAIALAFYRGHYLEGLVYLTTMCASALYHACDASLSPICVLRPSVLQYCDFLTAVVSLWVTLLCLAEVSVPLRTLVSTFGTLCIAIAVENDRTGFLVIALPAGLGLTLVFGSWVRQCATRRSCFPQPRFWLTSLAPGAALGVVGIALYTGFETHRNYAYVHSAWHALVGLSLFMVLPPKRRCPCDYFGRPPPKSSNPSPAPTLHAALSQSKSKYECPWCRRGSKLFP